MKTVEDELDRIFAALQRLRAIGREALPDNDVRNNFGLANLGLIALENLRELLKEVENERGT